jgi:protein dithiol oxidoreductase (disulfide-forming)
VAGTNYEVLKVAHPTSAPPGKVEVIEFFWYEGQDCYKLEPAIEAFVKKEGDRILFKRVPVEFGHTRLYAQTRLYYSLVSLGLEEKLMMAVYDEIHKSHHLFEMWDQADFLFTQGVDKQKFINACKSPTVLDLEQKGQMLIGDYRYQLDKIPTLVVAGRYKISIVNNGPEGMATVLDYVVKQVQDKKL